MPTVALQPGSTNTAAVKQLQDYLVSTGYMTQGQVNTGYGTYGPQTTAAVLALQKSLGIDYSSGPGDFGPITIAALQSNNAKNSATPSTGVPNVAPNVPVSNPTPPAPPPGSSSDPYSVGQQVGGGNANTAGTIQYQYTYQGNGNWTKTDTLGRPYGTVTTAQIQSADPSALTGKSASSPTPPVNNPGSTPTTPTADQTAELTSILNDPSLTPDMKSAIQAIYSATVTGDANKASQLAAAMQAASTYSDPYFKAQITLATDALARGVSSKEGDLAFNEKQLTDAQNQLAANTSASIGQLTFQQQQDLQQLAEKYGTDLGDTRDQMAAAGFTSSSKRARAEEILSDDNDGLVESTNQNYAYQTGNLQRALAAGATSTADQIANLQRTTSNDELDLYRTTEGQVGSNNLPSVPGLTPLGGIGGTIPENQITDATDFANNFVT